MTFTRFLDYVHPGDRDQIRESIHKASVDKDLSVEYRVELSPGKFRWIASRGRLSADPSGTADRVMGVSIDITRHKEMGKEASGATGGERAAKAST